jgi:hypothetical protein
MSKRVPLKDRPVTVTLTRDEASALMWGIGEGGIREPGLTGETSEKFRLAIEAANNADQPNP